MQSNINFTTDIFEQKSAVNKISYYNLFYGEIRQPVYPEGETYLNIIRCRSEEMYGKYSGSVKIEIKFQDDAANQLMQLFILKKGKNNNFGKFLYQVLGYEPEDELNLVDLEGKRILATIAHYYNDAGVGYANIAFCKST